MGAFDNLDNEEAPLSGIGGSYDAVSILIQDKLQGESLNSTPKILETGVPHRKKQLAQKLDCQSLFPDTKPAKKPSLPSIYEVSKELYKADK